MSDQSFCFTNKRKCQINYPISAVIRLAIGQQMLICVFAVHLADFVDFIMWLFKFYFASSRFFSAKIRYYLRLCMLSVAYGQVFKCIQFVKLSLMCLVEFHMLNYFFLSENCYATLTSL